MFNMWGLSDNQEVAYFDDYRYMDKVEYDLHKFILKFQ